MSLEIGKSVVTFVVTWPVFRVISGRFTYENRRGWESNLWIASSSVFASWRANVCDALPATGNPAMVNPIEAISQML
jgi:hypothetical protein